MKTEKSNYTEGEMTFRETDPDEQFIGELSIGKFQIGVAYRQRDSELPDELNKGNAKEMVKRWNMGKELLEVIRKAEKHHQGGHSEIGHILRSAIKKYEQK